MKLRNINTLTIFTLFYYTLLLKIIFCLKIIINYNLYIIYYKLKLYNYIKL